MAVFADGHRDRVPVLLYASRGCLQTYKVYESLLLAFGHLTTGVLFGFAILKHRMSVVLPQTESSLMSEELPETPEKEKSLLIEERKPFMAYERFLSFLGWGCKY